MGGRSRSAPAAPTETRVTQTDLPEYVQPYFERLLKRGEAESNQPYTPYGGERISYFSPDELTSQAMTRGYAQAGTPFEYQLASQRASMLGGPYGSGYDAGFLGNTYDAQGYGSGYQAGLVDSGYQARDLGLDFGARGLQSGYQARDAFSTYDPLARDSQYRAGQLDQNYVPLSYEENLERFMSPYQQNVVDIQKREALRQSEMLGDKTADAATRSGGLGGYREAIMQAERERNLGQQLDDIQARGSQAAFQSAQQQLERERAAGLGAAQFGLQKFGIEERGRQTEEQLDQRAFDAGERARQEAARLGLTAAQQNEAAQQAQEKFAQSAFAQTEQSRQAQEKFRQSAYQAGEAARQQAAKLGLTAAQQNEAARQAQEKYMQSAYVATEKSFQEQGRQDIEAFKAQEAARQAQERFDQQAYDMSQRYGLSSIDALRGVGGDIQDDVRQRIAALQGIGSQQRGMQQASLDMGYQDFLRQQGFTRDQLGFLGGLLRGVPVQPQQQISTYQQQPGLFQSALGMGLQGLGLYKGLS
tara:strand:+ start:1352 stop:2944 length:1593 start_codon:yes stop_codon:yes gene_type:complete